MIQSVVRSISFPKDVFKRLNSMAREQQRPRSRVLADAVRRYYRVWLLEREQAVGRKYAKRLGLKTEEDLHRLLES